MPRLNWSPPALRDMQRLYRFLEASNPEAARLAVRAIRAGVKVLARQPRIGRPVRDMGPEFHEWVIDFGENGYVALYRWDGTTAVILAVRHQREAGYWE